MPPPRDTAKREKIKRYIENQKQHLIDGSINASQFKRRLTGDKLTTKFSASQKLISALKKEVGMAGKQAVTQFVADVEAGKFKPAPKPAPRPVSIPPDLPSTVPKPGPKPGTRVWQNMVEEASDWLLGEYSKTGALPRKKDLIASRPRLVAGQVTDAFRLAKEELAKVSPPAPKPPITIRPEDIDRVGAWIFEQFKQTGKWPTSSEVGRNFPWAFGELIIKAKQRAGDLWKEEQSKPAPSSPAPECPACAIGTEEEIADARLWAFHKLQVNPIPRFVTLALDAFVKWMEFLDRRREFRAGTPQKVQIQAALKQARAWEQMARSLSLTPEERKHLRLLDQILKKY